MRAQEIIIEVGGMTCGHCEERVAAALRNVAGVTSAVASRSEGQAVVTADPSVAREDLLKKAVSDAGYEPGDVRFPE